uniref:Uncharacterized protein LOC104226588 n=1 Tax=Nicotiana sylvestris TaxID=4096 RepID=A0A1U7WQF2_NICSY
LYLCYCAHIGFFLFLLKAAELFSLLNKLEVFSRVTWRNGGSLSGEDGDNIDWDTEDELEIQGTPFSSCTDLRTIGQHVLSGDGEGFPEESIAIEIQQNGENEDLVLDALLAFKLWAWIMLRICMVFICLHYNGP